MLDLAFTKFLLTLSRNLSGLFLYCNYRTNCKLIFHLRLTLLKNGENLNIICKLAFEHRTLTSYPVREVYRCVKVLWKISLPSSSIQSLDEPLVKIMKLFFHMRPNNWISAFFCYFSKYFIHFKSQCKILKLVFTIPFLLPSLVSDIIAGMFKYFQITLGYNHCQ